jgi:hypothetical protein
MSCLEEANLNEAMTHLNASLKILIGQSSTLRASTDVSRF